MRIGIFPAAGKLGGSTYTHLLKTISPSDVVLIARHPEKIPSKYVEEGLQTRNATWDSSKEDFVHAFRGVECLFLISYPTPEHQIRTKAHIKAIDAALEANVSYIFYSSLGFARQKDTQSAAVVMKAHLDTEAYLKQIAQGKPSFGYTAIREGIYSESFPMYLSFLDPKEPPEEVLLPYGGAGSGIAWAKIDELGEATARLIELYVRSPDTYERRNQIVLLSGPRTWTLAETLELVGNVSNKGRIAVKEVDLAKYSNQERVQGAMGHLEDGPQLWATSHTAVRDGETAVANGELEKLLGRAPEAFDVTVRRMVLG